MRYIAEKILREHIRHVLRERDIAEEELAKDYLRHSNQGSKYKHITPKYVELFTNPGDIDNNPTLRAETDAIMSSADNWLTYGGLGRAAIGFGLSLTGVGAVAGVPLATVGQYMMGAGLAANVLNSSLKFQSAVIKGNDKEAATHLATLAIDIAIGGMASRISSAAARIVAERAAASKGQAVAGARRYVAARNLGYGAGKVTPGTKKGVRALRAAGGSISTSKDAGAFVGGTAASAAIIQIYNLLSGELTDIAIQYDEERKNQGLEPNPNLTKEITAMSERFSQGKPSVDDIGKLVTFGVNSGVLKAEDSQVLYESFLAEASGEALTVFSPDYGESLNDVSPDYGESLNDVSPEPEYDESSTSY